MYHGMGRPLQMQVNLTVFKTLINLHKKYRIIIHSIWISPILFAFAIFCAGAGHGVLGPYVFLYPYVSIISLYFDERQYGAEFAYGDLLLYVIYGVMLHLSKKRNKLEQSIIIILIVHVILAVSYYLIRYFVFHW